MDIDDTELEGIDNFYSNESIDKIADAFSGAAAGSVESLK